MKTAALHGRTEIPKLGPRICRKINMCSDPFLDILPVILHCLLQTFNLVHLNLSIRKYIQDEGKLYFTIVGLTHISVFEAIPTRLNH